MLTKRMQIQAIADVRAGFNCGLIDLNPSEFTEPYQAILGAVRNAQQLGMDTTSAMMASLNGCKDANLIIQEILGLVPGNGHKCFKSLAEIGPTLPPITWMWKDWIPRGLISLMGSVKGGGKSYWMLDICRRILHGEPFPDGQPTDMPDATIIYVDAELIPQLMYERAKNWDMDLRRFFLMQAPGWGSIDFVRQEIRDNLVEMCYSLKPQWLVLDSFGSLNSRGEDKKEDVQNLLQFFNRLCFEFNSGLTIVHHLRKKDPLAFADMISMDDFRGSGHIVQMSRTVIGLSIVQTGAERRPDGPRRIDMVTTNFAYPEPIGFEFKPGVGDYPVIVYGDVPQKYHEQSERERCEEMILEELGQKSMKPNDLLDVALRKGYSRGTMFRAHDTLERKGLVCDTLGNKNPDNEWQVKTS